ncbi:hypothetical protein Efla_006150 [Eimeria flavescens]
MRSCHPPWSSFRPLSLLPADPPCGAPREPKIRRCFGAGSPPISGVRTPAGRVATAAAAGPSGVCTPQRARAFDRKTTEGRSLLLEARAAVCFFCCFPRSLHAAAEAAAAAAASRLSRACSDNSRSEQFCVFSFRLPSSRLLPAKHTNINASPPVASATSAAAAAVAAAAVGTAAVLAAGKQQPVRMLDRPAARGTEGSSSSSKSSKIAQLAAREAALSGRPASKH